jgi:opacity protein-like surface antigen
MRGRIRTLLAVVGTICGVAQPALAQGRPAPIVETVVGRSGFIDEAWDYFTTLGGGTRVFVTPRLAIGPEVAYMSGEFDSLDASNLTITGDITFDFVHDDDLRHVVPYVAAGAGYLRQKTLVGSGPGSTARVPFTSSEATFSAGVGARIALSSLVFIAPEFRLGWEPESRIAVTIGIRPR